MLIDELCRTEGLSRSDFEPDTRVMAAMGHTISAPELLACLERWHQHTLALTRFHAQYDLWLSPTVSAPPLPIGALDTPAVLHMLNKLVSSLGLFGLIRKTSLFEDIVMKNLGWTPYTQLANLTGRPAMSVPLYWTPQGLPLGVQFVGPVNSEVLLLQLAGQLEQARPWFDRRPSL
jgi:amidase